MTQPIRIKISTHRTELTPAALRATMQLRQLSSGTLLEPNTIKLLFNKNSKNKLKLTQEGSVELYTEGTLMINKSGRIEISYIENKSSGMEGSKTTISFDPAQPQMVFMRRSGIVSTHLFFEPNKQCICSYRTPWMPIEIGVFTNVVENKLLSDGTLELDYALALYGAQAERTHFSMKIRTPEDDPIPRPEIMFPPM